MAIFSYFLNSATYFRNVQNIKHCLCLNHFSIFIYRKFNSYFSLYFSYCLVFKLYKSTLQFLHLISDHLIFLGLYWCWRLLSSGIFCKINFNLCLLCRCFFLPCKLCMSGLYIILYFGHGQYSMWKFLLLFF